MRKTMVNIHELARGCILAAEIEDKLAQTRVAVQAWNDGAARPGASEPPVSFALPGLPAALQLVEPNALRKRSTATQERRAALIHALAHIEFNAISLAWDAVYRFRDMPHEFYDDWVRIAGEEACHFVLLQQHLQGLGVIYGELPAHNGLWDVACSTNQDVLARMALVPRVMEARGLDVTPGMIERLQHSGDTRGAEILQIILRDEIGHVEAGSRWFRYVCEQRNMDPLETFINMVQDMMYGKIRKPLHLHARRQAGFSVEELQRLQQLADSN